jgi:MFS family permease
MRVTTEKLNVLILASAQALFQTASVLIMTVGGLAGLVVAADKSLATLPIAAVMVGTMAGTVPASLLMGRIGRRAGFILGAVIGALGGGLGALGMMQHSLAVLSAGTLLVGIYQSFAQYYRFAAAETASASFKSQAISLVLAGGVVAAIAGPQIGVMAKDLAGAEFAGSFLAIVVLSLFASALLAFLRMPAVAIVSFDSDARPLSAIVRQPKFLVALSGAAVGFGVMILAMTATPIAMVAHQHTPSDAAFVIQWHVLGMFVPSFFTGFLIARFGVLTMMLAGAIALAGHVAIALSGSELLYFLSALILLGVGWNFLFVGGTALLTETYRPSERAKVQALNDFSIFGVVVVASFSAGWLLSGIGWQGVNLAALPFLAAIAIAIGSFILRRPKATEVVADARSG